MTAPNAPKRLYLETWGCQMNVYDSERMRDLLAPLGYAASDTAEGADLVILNTCHIREKATEKVYSEIGRLRKLKDEKAASGGRMTLAVAGCVAQAEGAEIMARAPAVDLVFGPQAIHKLPEMIATAHRAAGERLETAFEAQAKFDALPDERHVDGPSAFLSVQEGCDKFCTFCVVPYTRGAEFSRDVDAIVGEARRLVQKGVRDITLLGQNVNAFHGTGPDGRTWNLAGLLRHLALIGGVERLRYTTSHPREMNDDLIAAHADTPAVMPFLHLPVQAGSDRILKAMNRKHTAAEYLAIIEKLRAARPDIALASDFIVGFPGETERDFEDTMALVRAANYAQAYSFKYSRRPGTPAAEMHGQVAPEVADDRLQRLQALLLEQRRAFNASQIGKRLPVLFDRAGRKPGQVQGRSPYQQSVHVDGPIGLIGSIVEVDIIAASDNSLTGRLASAQAAA
jgi:tRNA-2-methylthio-N6-dimethylallyladenosine synthase